MIGVMLDEAMIRSREAAIGAGVVDDLKAVVLSRIAARDAFAKAQRRNAIVCADNVVGKLALQRVQLVLSYI